MTYTEAKIFIREWEHARTLKEFAAMTGYDRRYASNAAANFRRNGVDLKRMSCGQTHYVHEVSQEQYAELREICRRERDVAEADAVRRRCAGAM